MSVNYNNKNSLVSMVFSRVCYDIYTITLDAFRVAGVMGFVKSFQGSENQNSLF